MLDFRAFMSLSSGRRRKESKALVAGDEAAWDGEMALVHSKAQADAWTEDTSSSGIPGQCPGTRSRSTEVPMLLTRFPPPPRFIEQTVKPIGQETADPFIDKPSSNAYGHRNVGNGFSFCP